MRVPPVFPAALDNEEVRIFRQSQPAEAVTRDFLQELLQEHRQVKEARRFDAPGRPSREGPGSQ